MSPRPSQETLFPYTAEYEYDYLGWRVGRRVWQWNGSAWVEVQRRQFAWDGWKLLLELDRPGGSGAAVPLRAYTWGLDLAGLAGSVNSLEGAGTIGGLLAVYGTYGTTSTGDDVSAIT